MEIADPTCKFEYMWERRSPSFQKGWVGVCVLLSENSVSHTPYDFQYLTNKLG